MCGTQRDESKKVIIRDMNSAARALGEYHSPISYLKSQVRWAPSLRVFGLGHNLKMESWQRGYKQMILSDRSHGLAKESESRKKNL
jgi:hypothetical protein